MRDHPPKFNTTKTKYAHRHAKLGVFKESIVAVMGTDDEWRLENQINRYKMQGHNHSEHVTNFRLYF